jgi:competence ComEA-like helix-hairpin-helix protein
MVVRRITLSAVVLSSLLLASCARDRELLKATAAVNRNLQPATAPPCVSLNRATAAELSQLPGIGEVMSHRIVEYRERHGAFRRPEEIIIVEGFSEKKYRAIADMICDK